MSRRDIIDSYNDEIDQVWEDYEEGKISEAQRNQFIENLMNNMDNELAEQDA